MKQKETIPYLIGKSIVGLLFLPFWYIQKCFKRDPRVWLFGSWFGQKYSDNSRALYEYVLEYDPDIKPMWITHNKEVYNRLKELNRPVQMANTIAGKIACLKAGVVFVTTSPDEMNSKYLNGAKMVWLWHGMPLKQIMADEIKFLKTKQSPFKRFKVKLNHLLFPYENKYKKDLVMNSSEFFTPFFSSAFQVQPDQIWTDGYPRNDALFSTYTENIVKEYRAKFPTAKFIIYMPTHRVNGLKGEPFNGFNGHGFNQEKFFKTLEDNDYVFFNKGHFFDSNANITLQNDRFVNVTDSCFDNLYTFVKDMDILITDYSSIYCDYILLGKPIILTPFDYNDYINNERPLYFDYNVWEGIKATNWNELTNILYQHSYHNPTDKEIDLFHKNRDGNSCRRITEHLKSTYNI